MPPLSLVYSGDQLFTFYAIVGIALVCEGAEAWDAWLDRRDIGALRLVPWARGLVVLVVVYLALVGLTEIGQGIAGSRGGAQAPGDLVASGALILGAATICVVLFWRGTAGVPGLGGLRAGRPISWFALAAVTEAFAQNLAPGAGSASVAATIARPVSAGDLITGSLPYGVVGLLLVGPVVRRNLGDWLARLGAVPLRPAWTVLGGAAGIALVPALSDAFSVPGRDAWTVLRIGLAIAGAVVVAVPRTRWALRSAIRRRDGSETAAAIGRAHRLVGLAVGLLAAGAALSTVGMVAGAIGAGLPGDCIAQQEQVSQSLAGGEMGRSWFANLGIALAAGVDEEILFRGAIQPRFGIWISSFLFASFHLQYTCHGLPSVGDLQIVVLGVAFGLLRQRGGLLAAIAAHAAYDATILLGLSL